MKRRSDKNRYSQTKRILGEFGLKEIITYLLSNYKLNTIIKSLSDTFPKDIYRYD